MSFFTELKRRHVFKVGAAYLVVGWVMIEVASTVAPHLSLPEWAPRLITFIVIIGFPLALVLAWIFDMTPQGVQVTQGSTGNKRFYATVTVVAAAMLGWFFYNGAPEETQAPETDALGGDGRASIAVLPFVNMSGNPENEYFSDGLTETLLHMLAQVSELRVAARTSAFAFKNTNIDVREIATQLGVATVLEGSVQRAGERVRVTAQLIDARDGSHLWSGSYDRTLEDIFAIQDEIADEVADALTVSLLGSREHQSIGAVGTRSTAAYDLYLRGLERRNVASYSSLPEAVQFFQDALAEDSNFDDARVALAATYLSMSDTGFIQQPEAAASMRAALAPLLAQQTVSPQAAGYAAVADLLAVSGILTPELRQSISTRLDAALARAPDDTGLLEIVGNFVGRWLGDSERSMQLLEHAVEIDPLNGDLRTSYGFRLLAEERYDDALENYARMREFVPGHSFGYLGPARVAELHGELAESVMWHAQAAQADRRDHEIPAGAAEQLLWMGLVAEATPWLRQAELLNATGDDTLRVGIMHADLSGDHDRALALAEGVLRARSQNRRNLYRTAAFTYLRIMMQRGEADVAVALLESVAPGMTAARLSHPPRDQFDLGVVMASVLLAANEAADTRRARAETFVPAVQSLFPQWEPDDGDRRFQALVAGDHEAALAGLVAGYSDENYRGTGWQRVDRHPLERIYADERAMRAALAGLSQRMEVQAQRYRAIVASGEITVP